MSAEKEISQQKSHLTTKINDIATKNQTLMWQLQQLNDQNAILAANFAEKLVQQEQENWQDKIIEQEQQLVTKIDQLRLKENGACQKLMSTDENILVAEMLDRANDDRLLSSLVTQKNYLYSVVPINNYQLPPMTITQKTLVNELITKLETNIIAAINQIDDALVFNFKKECQVTIVNLKTTDIVQGTNLQVKVVIFKGQQAIRTVMLLLAVIYDYDKKTQLQLLEAILTPAIPQALLKDRHLGKYELLYRWAEEYHNIAQEVEQVIPLPWLLPEPDFAVAIGAELLAASYWTCFHTKWWGIWGHGIDNGAWQAYSIIPNYQPQIAVNSNSITEVQKLFNLNQGYFNAIFTIIEQKLQAMGIDCQVQKKMIYDRVGSPFAVGMGNSNFYNSVDYQTPKTFDNSKRQFFVQVNFDVLINSQKIEYPGVVFVLSDILKLYD